MRGGCVAAAAGQFALKKSSLFTSCVPCDNNSDVTVPAVVDSRMKLFRSSPKSITSLSSGTYSQQELCECCRLPTPQIQQPQLVAGPTHLRGRAQQEICQQAARVRAVALGCSGCS